MFSTVEAFIQTILFMFQCSNQAGLVLAPSICFPRKQLSCGIESWLWWEKAGASPAVSWEAARILESSVQTQQGGVVAPFDSYKPGRCDIWRTWWAEGKRPLLYREHGRCQKGPNIIPRNKNHHRFDCFCDSFRDSCVSSPQSSSALLRASSTRGRCFDGHPHNFTFKVTLIL